MDANAAVPFGPARCCVPEISPSYLGPPCQFQKEIGITRLTPQAERAEAVLGVSLTILGAPAL